MNYAALGCAQCVRVPLCSHHRCAFGRCSFLASVFRKQSVTKQRFTAVRVRDGIGLDRTNDLPVSKKTQRDDS
jgi:hypothetical protein